MSKKQPSKKSMKNAEKRAKDRAEKMGYTQSKISSNYTTQVRTKNTFGNILIYLSITLSAILMSSLHYLLRLKTGSAIAIVSVTLTILLLLILITRTTLNKPRKDRLKIAAWSVVVLVTMLTGTVTQITVNDEPVLKYTKKYDIYKISVELFNDMQILEQNQIFFTLPYAQSRGLTERIEMAIRQDKSIAERWNPATAGDLPLPGFYEVLTLTNKTADLQMQALDLLQQELKQPDSKRADEIAKLIIQINDNLLGELGAAAKLSDTIKPSGVKLTVGE